MQNTGRHRNGDFFKRVVATLYSWQHCGTVTSMLRQPCILRKLWIPNFLCGQFKIFFIYHLFNKY